MAIRSASAQWEGTLREGKGSFAGDSGALNGAYSFSSRFEDGGTNPEELLGAAHAACYSMALNAAMERAGTPASSVKTTAKVHLEKLESGFSITKIDLETNVVSADIEEATFHKMAQDTKDGCLVSRALSAVPMSITAHLHRA